MIQQTEPAQSVHPGMGFKQFVALIAAMMAVNALSIDTMLPALSDIARDLSIASPNDRQWVVTAYLLGFGSAQLVYGPLSDRYGRRPVLIVGIALYTLCSLIAGFATSLDTMILARLLQGIGAASTRVVSVAIVRDCYSGRQMARVMSLTFVVFLVTPVIAPTIGQGITMITTWHWIFAMFALFGAIILTWMVLRLPETLHPEDRGSLELGGIARAFGLALRTRDSLGYMIAMTLMIGALFGFINSSQQVFAETFGAPAMLTLAFALVGSFMAASSFLNSQIVERLGMRRVSHGALIGFIVFAAIHFGVSLTGHETMVVFLILQPCMMFCFGLIGSNFGSMAMEPLGHIAGTASSLQGFVTTTGGALIGFLIGQAFDGTTLPLTFGFLSAGLLALLTVLATERWRLFRPVVHPVPQPARP